MKKNLLLLISIILLITVALASCEKKCEHTFSDKWNSDAENHWHPATCEHAETERGNLAPHADANEDGICDVCEYEVGHNHTYESGWSITDTHHWKTATCTHTDKKQDYSTHSDEDINGICDVCSGHVHKTNAAGYCVYDDCGKKVKEIDETSLDALVNAVVDQHKLVNGGNIDYNFTGRSNTSSDFETLRKELVSYVFGKDNYTYTKVTTNVTNGGNEASGIFESWHQLMNNEETFGVVSVDGGDLTLDISEPAKLNGYYIALSTLAGDYGVEATLYALYEAAIADTTDELIVTPDTAENKVMFKYSYKTVFINENKISVGDENTPAGSIVYNVNYFDVEVTFTYSDEYALTGLMIAVDCYTNDPGTADGVGFLYDDVDIQYDPETGDVTFIEYVKVKNENTAEGQPEYIWVAQPTDIRTPDTYIINVTQTVGERSEENPNSQSKFIPESFDLFLKMDENTGALSDKYDGGIIKIDVRGGVHIYVGNYSPAGTSLHFVEDKISIKVFKNNEELGNLSDYMNDTIYAEFTFAGEQREFLLVPKMDGVYRLEVYFMGNKTHEVTIHAGVVDEEFIELKDNEFAVKVTEAYTWSGEVSFTASEAGKYYFNLPAGVGFVDADAYDAAEETPDTGDSPEPYFDYNDRGKENGGSFSLELEAGQTVRFYVNAKKPGTYVIAYVLF